MRLSDERLAPVMRWYGGVMIPSAWTRFLYRGFLYVRTPRGSFQRVKT